MFTILNCNYKEIWDIIDDRWEMQLYKPLHAVGYYLNPSIHYDPYFDPGSDIKLGLYTCLQQMVSRS